MNTNSVIRTLDLHINKNAYRTSNRSYYCVYVIDANGVKTPCLLTEDDVVKGIDRAYKNPEDVLPLGKLQLFVQYILALFS